MLTAVLQQPTHPIPLSRDFLPAFGSQDPRTGPSRLGEAGSAMSDIERLTTLVGKVLDEAQHALGKDDVAARTCIGRASALLRAEEDRTRMDGGGAAKPLARGGLAPWQARRVARHIDENLESPIRMHDFAEITRLSTSYFSRAFKGSFGVSPHAYVVRRRLECAQELMLKTDEPICHIAFACGLCDQAHFSKLFRRLVGSSPQAWRRQRRENPPAL